MQLNFSSRLHYLRIVFAMAVAFFASRAQAVNISYANPTGPNDFAVNENWVGNVAPGVSDISLIDGVDGINDYPYVDSTRSIQRFTIASTNGSMGGIELRNNGNLGAIANNVSYVGARGAGQLRIQSGSTLSTNGILYVGWGDTAGHGTGNVVQTGGSYTGNSSSGGITMGVSAADANFPASSGTYTLNDGTVTLGGTLVVGLAGTGTFNMNGGSVTTGNFLQIGRTGNGTFIHKAGPLVVNRSSLDAMVVGAVAGGVGKYEISGGSLAVNTTGAAGVAIGIAAGTASGTFKVVGNGATSISIAGDYKQYVNSNLTLEIGAGITPISLTGNAVLGGALNVSFTTTPTIGQQFTIMNYGGTETGSFTTFDKLVDSPLGPNSVPISVSYGSGAADSVILTVRSPGDYDRNGAVEMADYALWRQAFGTVGQSDADGNGDNEVNAADYVIWRQYFTGSGSSSGLSQASSVPEPSAGIMCSILAAATFFRRRLRCVTTIKKGKSLELGNTVALRIQHSCD